MILYQDDDYLILLDYAPVIEGHLLLATKHHTDSFKKIPDPDIPNFIKIKNYIRQILTKEYGGAIFFENNLPRTLGEAGTNDDHAHIQCIPMQESIIKDLDTNFPERIKVDDWYELKEKANDIKECYYYEDITGEMYVLPSPEKPTDQLIRSIVAKKIGYPKRAFWKEYIEPELREKGKERLASVFKKIK